MKTSAMALYQPYAVLLQGQHAWLGMLQSQSMCVKYDMMCTCELGAFQLKILAV